MESWTAKKLGDFCSRVSSGGTPLRSIQEYYENGTIPWLKTGEVKKNLIYDTEEKITETGLENSSAKLIPVNSVIVAMYGDGDTAGNVAINKIPLTTNQACCNFTLNPEQAHYRFIYYYLKGSYNNLINLKLGGSQQNLNAQSLKSFPINHPDVKTQKKIAAILSAYDELIENNQRRIALLEKMAEEIYREWFVRLRFPGHEKVKFVKGLPLGWAPLPSNKVFRVMSGGTPNTDNAVYWDGDIPFFTPKDADDNFYVLKTERAISQEGLESCNSHLYKKDTIFITARGTVGKICLAYREMAMNQTCYALSPIEDGDVYFHFLSMKNAITYIKGISKSGVFDNIIVDTFKNIPMFMPPAPLIVRFNEYAAPIFRRIGLLLESNELLTETRDQLLPRLISGKLSVENLDIQFPPGMEEVDHEH